VLRPEEGRRKKEGVSVREKKLSVKKIVFRKKGTREYHKMQSYK
jgi:hypothetical protein